VNTGGEGGAVTFAVFGALKMAEPLVFQGSAVFMLHILCSSKTLMQFCDANIS
jgi:hypothetical protein